MDGDVRGISESFAQKISRKNLVGMFFVYFANKNFLSIASQIVSDSWRIYSWRPKAPEPVLARQHSKMSAGVSMLPK